MRLKSNVFPGGMRPELMLALVVAEQVFKDRGLQMVVTSMNDSKHGATSKHPMGMAADVRSKHVPRAQLPELISDLKAALPWCDVILEFQDQEQEHCHLELELARARPSSAETA